MFVAAMKISRGALALGVKNLALPSQFAYAGIVPASVEMLIFRRLYCTFIGMPGTKTG